MPSDFNQADWLLKYAALPNKQQAKWEEHGHDVHVEGQNAFCLRGKSATLAGRPDLILDRFDDTLIIDVKTGRDQPWHVAQVMIYLYALPRTLPQYRDVQLAGEIAYPTHTVEVPEVGRQGRFARNLASLIRRLASDAPPQRRRAPTSAGSATSAMRIARSAWTRKWRYMKPPRQTSN